MTATSVLDGTGIATLEDFWRVTGEAVNGPGGCFGRNPDALADCLSGGFGTPDDHDFVFEWHDHETSRARLGHPETARQLEIRLARCHPSNRAAVAAELAEALARTRGHRLRLAARRLRAARPGSAAADVNQP